MKNKIIVSGANGFIGARLCNKLVEKGFEVIGIIKDINEDCSFLSKKVRIVYCELSNYKQLFANSLLENSFCFVHLAWAGVSSDLKNDFTIQFNNIEYSVDAIKLADRMNCSKFVGVGSASEFSYSSSPISGAGIPSPSDYYSTAKVSSKMFCSLYAKKHNLDYCWCHITSIYGPGRDDNNLLSYTIKSLLTGSTPSYTKLEQIWDYIYIDDLIEALIVIIEKGKTGESYAVGSGTNMPLLFYVNTIRELINPNAKINLGTIPYKTNKIDNSIIDISNLLSLGFIPKVPFYEGIRQTIDFYRKVYDGQH